MPAAHFGALVVGIEIQYKVARAKGKSSRVSEGYLGIYYHHFLLNLLYYIKSSLY
jgi:hypothetical protein